MNCPICSAAPVPLIAYPKQPVFMYPLPADADVEQIVVDLAYGYCPECGHGFQKQHHQEVLEKIYESHYWTPDHPDACHSLRDEFIDFCVPLRREMGDEGISTLEIGASSGSILAALLERFPQDRLTGFEPNTINAQAAREKGVEMVNGFFTLESAREHGRRYDLIYSRHVIEHIFDLEEFFTAIGEASRDGATLILETPSLDESFRRDSQDPFHLEHVHVFSLSSMARLAARFGWELADSRITSFNNLVAVFKRGDGSTQEIPLPTPHTFEDRLPAWREVINGLPPGKSVLLWGCGLQGAKVLMLLGLDPAEILDGNPNKAGMRFVGIDKPIQNALPFAENLVREGRDRDHVILITSTFHQEIRADLDGIFWGGDVITLI